LEDVVPAWVYMQMYVYSAVSKNYPQYSSTLKMEITHSSEMLPPTYKTTRRQHIPEDTYMIILNLLKIFLLGVHAASSLKHSKTPENVVRVQECRETKLSQTNRGAFFDHINFKHDS
jgi:hypothetical protein